MPDFHRLKMVLASLHWKRIKDKYALKREFDRKLNEELEPSPPQAKIDDDEGPSTEAMHAFLKKLGGQECTDVSKEGDEEDEPYDFQNAVEQLCEVVTDSTKKDTDMRTAHEVSSDKPLKTTLKDFYGNRKTDLEMLDNHADFLEADPDHTKMTLKRFLGMRKRERLALLEVGPGNGRNTETTLMDFFGRIDMIEPSDNLRETAIERMEALNRGYDNIFPCTVQNFEPLAGVKYDAVFCQFVLMYCSDSDIITFLRKISKNLNPGALIFIKENAAAEGDTYIAKGKFEGIEDRSLVRSKACFRHIFAAAGFEDMIMELWDPTRENYSVHNIVLRRAHNTKNLRHRDCVGKHVAQSWDSVEADQSTKPCEEVKIPVQEQTVNDKQEHNKTVTDTSVNYRPDDNDGLQELAREKNQQVDGLKLLYEDGVFIDLPTTVTKSVECEKQKGKKQEYEEMDIASV